MWIIYRITNNVNGYTYIGQHKTSSILKDDGYMGSGLLIKAAYKKYGIENFTKTIITIGISKKEADILETFYIKKERYEGKAQYNIADGAFGGDTSKFIDYSKVSNALKGKPKSYEHKQKLKGEFSKEHKENLSKACMGRIPWNKNKSNAKIVGRHFYNNGEIEVLRFFAPEGFVKGRLPKKRLDNRIKMEK